jgi:DNA repair protein RadC
MQQNFLVILEEDLAQEQLEAIFLNTNNVVIGMKNILKGH